MQTRTPVETAAPATWMRPSSGLDDESRQTYLRMAARRGVRRDFYVVHHVPVGADGTDYFAAYRARNQGYACYIGFTMFETDRIPSGWADACNGMDEIWVPSRFNLNTFSASGVDPDKLHVIPLGFDPKPYRAPAPPLSIPGRKGFVFLSVFQWSPRKGADLLVRAFLETFDDREDVSLVIRSSGLEGESVQDRLVSLIRSLGRDPARIPSIVLLDAPVLERDLPSLYAAADAFVLPSRGEGWGIPYLEAMASALPVIGTRWSGNMEFMHDGNSFLIDLDGLVPVHEEEAACMPMYRGHRYAEPSMDHLKRLLREVFEDRDLASARGAAARGEVLAKWTHQGTAAAMMNRFKAWRARWRSATLRGANPAPPVVLREPVPETGPAMERARVLEGALRGDPAIHLASEEPGRGGDMEGSEKPVVLHQGDPTRYRIEPPGAVHIGRTAFPAEPIPGAWADALNRMDEVWVPSGFQMRSFERAGVDREKMVTVPPVVEAYRFGPHLEKRPLAPDPGFVFLSVLPWMRRKGWDVLVEAFCREFRLDEAVTLFLKVTPPPSMPPALVEKELLAFIQDRLRLEPGECPRIKLATGRLDREEMPFLYRAADAFVLPTRGEAFGQALLEALVSGLPAIATGWSGHLEFMNERNAWLLDFERAPVPPEAIEEDRALEGCHWAEPSLTDLRRCMRKVFEEPGPSRERALWAREEAAEKFAPGRVSRCIAERLAFGPGAAKSSAPARSADTRLRLVVEGAFSCKSSTALVNRELGRALLQRGRVSLAARSLAEGDAFEDKDAFSLLNSALCRRFQKPAQVHVWHQWPPSAAAPSAGRWVVFQGWEYGSLPRKIHALFRSGPDEIWTYSTNCAREFEADGIPRDRIQVIPLGVDPDRFRPEAGISERLQGLTERKTVFLFVGGTVWRKGIDLLLSAYCRAFTHRDDVALVIKEMGSDSFYRNYNLTQAVERLAGNPRAPEIVLLAQELADSEMPGLYRACDCLVHPYRGEGFGLPVLEALACGLPAIVTAGGACDDFLPEEGVLRLPALRREIGLPLETVRPAWVLEPDRDALVSALRKFASDPVKVRRQAQESGNALRREWSWERTAACVEARCGALAD